MPFKKITWKRRGTKKKFNYRTFKKDKVREEAFESIIEENIDENSLIPFVEEAENPKEELIVLLKFAAEVEHALMVQYLYAAYTINERENALKDTLLVVARQEMGHFLAVQNILISLGGIAEVHLHKSILRTPGPNNPLPFTLEPLSREALARFLAVEAPPFQNIPPAQREEVVQIHNSVKATGIVINPVGALYKKIESIIETEMTDADFRQEPVFEADRGSWDFNGAVGQNALTLEVVHTKENALVLLKEIASQGEGADLMVIDSHFEMFLDSFKNFEQLPIPIINAPTNPIIRDNPEFLSFIKIENDYTLLWAHLMNDTYTSLLLDIYSTMFYRQFNELSKDLFIRVVFTNMRTLIPRFAGILFTLPAQAGAVIGALPLAGPTFEIDEAFELSTDKQKMDVLNSSFISKIENGVLQIRQHAFFAGHNTADRNVRALLKSCEEYCATKKSIPINPLIT